MKKSSTADVGKSKTMNGRKGCIDLLSYFYGLNRTKITEDMKN